MKQLLKRLFVSSLLACSLLVAITEGVGKGTVTGQKYHLAKHGYSGGLAETVDLTKVEGFDKVRTLRDVAEFASKVPGIMGFTAHPNFESGERYAEAVVWYTKLSPTESSWPLYLFDEIEAQKPPGETPKASSIAAAKAKVSGKLKMAQKLIDAAGENGVELFGDYEEQKVLALAILRLNGSLKHAGKFDTAYCLGCRSVVPGGTPKRCGLGVINQKHWNCCGASQEAKHCLYWALIKAQDDAGQMNIPNR